MRCCSSRAGEREPHAAPTPQNLEMTDAHVRARAQPSGRVQIRRAAIHVSRMHARDAVDGAFFPNCSHRTWFHSCSLSLLS